MSETAALIDSIRDLASSIVDTSTILVSVCKSLERTDQRETEKLIRKLSKSEERTDSIFEAVAERIMSVEFLNINPDYLLDIARHIDEISDSIERAALLFQYLGEITDQDLIELLIDAATQVQKITVEVVECSKRLSTGNGSVKEICDLVSEREKAVDALREEFNSHVVSGTATPDQKPWLKDIFGNFDRIADLGRDLSILFRVVGIKLEKQRTLTLKRAVR